MLLKLCDIKVGWINILDLPEVGYVSVGTFRVLLRIMTVRVQAKKYTKPEQSRGVVLEYYTLIKVGYKAKWSGGQV